MHAAVQFEGILTTEIEKILARSTGTAKRACKVLYKRETEMQAE